MKEQNQNDAEEFFLSKEEINSIKDQRDLKELDKAFEAIMDGLDIIYDKLDEIKEIESNCKYKFTI